MFLVDCGMFSGFLLDVSLMMCVVLRLNLCVIFEIGLFVI